jgi:uroporphyrinogen-III decarboxylase
MNAKENLLRAIRRDDPAWVPGGMEALHWVLPPVTERQYQEGKDDFGDHWSYDPKAEGGTYPTAGGNSIKDLKQWRSQIHMPDVSAMNWGIVDSQVENVNREENLVVGFVEMGLFERCYMLLGFEEALMSYMTDTEEMSALCGAIADYKIELIRKLHHHAGVEMIWYGDDWGTQDRLFLPPDTWRKVIKPHTQRIYDCMKELGIIINQHCCGHIEAVFGDMVDMGADIWNPCQPCNDLGRLKAEFGDRICFAGGIDSQFVLNKPGATEEGVRREVRRRIDELAPGGGYIAAPSHAVPTDPKLQQAMKEEISNYGRAFYAKAPS